MNTRIAATVIAITLLATGCSSDDTTATPTPDPTPSATITEAPTPEPEVTATEPAQEPTSDPAAPVAYDDYTIATEALEGGFPDAVDTYGADEVFAAVVRNEAPITVGVNDIPTATLVEGAIESCAMLDAGATFDDVFMASIVDMPEDNSTNDLANFAWSIVLTSVDTHCPQHLEAREAWYGSGH